MTALAEIVRALDDAGLVAGGGVDPRPTQGSTIAIAGYPRAIRLYAWFVSDNGTATGLVRRADERRIQVTAQVLDVSLDPETVVLGWADDFSPVPLIVAFNPFGIAARVNSKMARKLAAGIEDARASDSQQFRQELLDDAARDGIAVGENQHGERVLALRPERFVEYLTHLKPLHQPGTSTAAIQQGGGMRALVAAAELEEDAPVDPSAADEPTFDPNAIEDAREIVAREVAIRRGQARFRRALIELYGRCMMTGCAVEDALEAAHVVRYQGPGTNHVANGLLLRADIHTLFDLGLIAVDDDLKIIVSSELASSEYAPLHGQPLFIPDGVPGPSRKAIGIHRAFAQL